MDFSDLKCINYYQWRFILIDKELHLNNYIVFKCNVHCVLTSTLNLKKS